MLIFAINLLRDCITYLYNRITGRRVKLLDEEEPTLSQRDVRDSIYGSSRTNVSDQKKQCSCTHEHTYIHQDIPKKANTDKKQHPQRPLVIKKTPNKTKQVSYCTFRGSQLQVINKGLTTLDNKSLPNHSIKTTKKPPSQIVITSQTPLSCVNCSQIFTETNPLLRVSKENKLHCVGCQRLFFEIKKKNRTIQSLQQMMMSQGHDKAFIYTKALGSSNRVFLHTEKCQIYAERLRANMIQRKKEFCKNQGDSSKRPTMNKLKKQTPEDEDDDMVTVQQLVELMRRSGSKCAITRLTGIWCTSFSTHPFRLTVDHIVPVYKGGSFAVTNLQITFKCINQLKGHYHNSHLIEYVSGYKEANKSIA